MNRRLCICTTSVHSEAATPINFQSTNGGMDSAFFAENNRGKTSYTMPCDGVSLAKSQSVPRPLQASDTMAV